MYFQDAGTDGGNKSANSNITNGTAYTTGMRPVYLQNRGYYGFLQGSAAPLDASNSVYYVRRVALSIKRRKLKSLESMEGINNIRLFKG
jgi:hypothetical protein